MYDRYTTADFAPEQVKDLNVEGLYRDLGKTLIIAPHPDDETLGCGGLILLLRKQECPVSIVFITDGSSSHPNSKEVPPSAMKEIRHQEAIKAAQALKVEEEDLYFLEVQDNHTSFLSLDEKQIIQEQLAVIINQTDCTTILTPWRRDAHGDHRFSTQLVINILKDRSNPPLVVEYPIWLWKNGKEEDWPLHNEIVPFQVAVDEVLDIKQEALDCHRSQLGQIVHDDPEGFVLTKPLQEPFFSSKELYFFPPKGKKETLPAAYFDALYQQSEDPWNFRNSTYEKKKYQRTIDIIRKIPVQSVLELGCSIGVLTKGIAKHVTYITAVDISQKAIEVAKETTREHEHITFYVQDLKEGFDYGTFDLVLLSEICYYYHKDDLLKLLERCKDSLNSAGYVLLVHWTGFVRDYPLTGKQVHTLFQEQYVKTGQFKVVQKHQEDLYELLLCQLQH